MSIAITRAAEYTPACCEAAVERVFCLLKAPEAIGPDTKILLKPNLLSKSAPEKAVTTHPEMVRAVIRACVRRGARPENITLADSAGGLYNPAGVQALYKVCGMAAVCAEEGVNLYTACESVPCAVENGAVVRQFELLRPVLEADFIIDLPKFKTHVMTGMTAATKNLFGCIPGLKKAEWHTRFPDRERFGRMLIDLLLTVKPAMAVLDGIVGMEGDGPGGGEPRAVGAGPHAGALPEGCGRPGSAARRRFCRIHAGRRSGCLCAAAGLAAALQLCPRRRRQHRFCRQPHPHPRLFGPPCPAGGAVHCPSSGHPPLGLHRLRPLRRDLPPAHHPTGPAEEKGQNRDQGLHPLLLLPRDVPGQGR